MIDQVIQLASQYGWQAAVLLMGAWALSQWASSRLQAETAQKTDADTVQSMVKSLTASYDELVGKYENLRTEMAELIRVKADDERRIAHLEMLVETMKADIHDLKVIRDDLQHRYDEAIQKLANCERKRLEAELLIAELEAELTKG